MHRMKLTRRKWLARSLLYGGPVCGFAYGAVIEKRRLSVTRQRIPLTARHAALDGLKIAVMGDFHHDDFGDDSLIRRAVNTINEEKVDLVCLVGDYITSDPAAMEPLCEELQHLRSKLGTFGVMGNHDCWHFTSGFLRSLDKAGVRMLINEAHAFEHFSIVGIDSIRGGRPDMPFALKQVPPDKTVLLAWHEPDTFDTVSDPRVALQLSGHTHGGQICAPFYGPILLPPGGKKYPHGYYRRGDASLVVTRGIGTLNIPARFLCRPELVLLNLAACRT